jgi:hypothetical protein
MNSFLSPQIIEHKKDNNMYELGAHVLAWDRHKNVVELNVCIKKLR